MAAWFDVIADVILPPSCVGCREAGSWWCDGCASRVVTCRRPIAQVSEGLDGILAGAYFRRPLAGAVKALKYRHARAVGGELVRYLEPPLARIGTVGAALVPIPLHVSRLRKRGHNQAAVLAKILSERSGVRWSEALRRTRPTHTQTTLHRRERFTNVSGAFEWTGPVPGTVVLIDDVVTTGATFAAAAAAVRAAGASEVWGLAVAQADLSSKYDEAPQKLDSL